MKKTMKELYERNNEYNKTAYDRIAVMLPKGTKERVKAVASAKSISVNKFISELILNEIGGILDASGAFAENEGQQQAMETSKPKKEPKRLTQQEIEELYSCYGRDMILSGRGQLELLGFMTDSELHQLHEYAEKQPNPNAITADAAEKICELTQ